MVAAVGGAQLRVESLCERNRVDAERVHVCRQRAQKNAVGRGAAASIDTNLVPSLGDDGYRQ
jgi:hypothetical protein